MLKMPEQYNARPASRELGNAIALGIGVKGIAGREASALASSRLPSPLPPTQLIYSVDGIGTAMRISKRKLRMLVVHVIYAACAIAHIAYATGGFAHAACNVSAFRETRATASN